MSERQSIALEGAPYHNGLNAEHAALKLWRENGFPLFPGAGKRPCRTYPQVKTLTSDNYATDYRV